MKQHIIEKVEFISKIAKGEIIEGELMMTAFFIDEKNNFIVDEDGAPAQVNSAYHESGKLKPLTELMDNVHDVCSSCNITNVIIVFESWVVKNENVLKDLEIRKHNSKKEVFNIVVGFPDGSSQMRCSDIIRNESSVEFKDGEWMPADDFIKSWA